MSTIFLTTNIRQKLIDLTVGESLLIEIHTDVDFNRAMKSITATCCVLKIKGIKQKGMRGTSLSYADNSICNFIKITKE